MNLKPLKLTERRRQLLEKMGITLMEDLLKTYPFRYEMIETLPFSEWKEQDHVAFEGLICSAASIIRLSGNRSMTRFRVISWDEEIEVTLFNRPWPGQFSFGKSISVFGIYQGKNKVTASNYNFQPIEQQKGLNPVYSLPKDMKQSDMKAVIAKALPYADVMADVVPSRFRQKYRLWPRAQAICQIHKPTSRKDLHQAIRSLKYEEFLCFQCALQAMGRQEQNKEPKKIDENLMNAKIQELPYPLTADQKSALQEILEDMRSDVQMVRMVQGDVGCGKTSVAALSIYACVLSGWQAAFLAPTEILARQHVNNLKKMNIECELLVSGLPSAKKKEVLDHLEDGSVQVVVGTHALFQENVQFDKLGLIIADEQQRFGVRQRRSLLEKGDRADFLMMTATPIPRTYAHFLYGDISLSSIKTMPPGRQPVKTKYIKGSSMGPILPQILQGIQEGRQVYVVCPAIDENPDMDIKAAMKIYDGMQKTMGSKIKIAMMHGKMKNEEKESIMRDFSSGEVQILVSTTVIEVGIDVPNATMMVIYDAHRFGLSTLHQLRGRAARGSVQGECFLLSASKDAQAVQRLKQMETMLDGFAISEYDLQQRGPGDLLGLRQSGLPTFILGDLEKDSAIMEVCMEDARDILQRQIDTPMLEYVQKAVDTMQYID